MISGVCPYPGLRPFTEEESIFFKGRDVHIRMMAKLLETKKMAFITGASGDGKSSMVYAGLLPFIRAGFLKAGFNKWIIADFKPQRNPLKSLCEALSRETLLDVNYLIEELDNGFSSIIEVYKRNGFYVENGVNAVNKGRNLLIIADQFEEIFTNKDNFENGEPSLESYTTVNLLLETVRIAVAENLPVYVVFTMRSDFISQCTAFKNLPEFIAYAQFFVPQLKRGEITQVIEEPAVLAGSSVSSRLTDVLVNNLGSGFDQLPVLQHTMNLLWKNADYGQEQLDLLHLAKIAGISKDVLDEKDRQEFEKWFQQLPEFQKKYFDKPSLSNVLNTHAGVLYESAYEDFQKNASWAHKNITKEESELIIKTAFKSLVKIDNSRPVRNRCTLDEITGSVNRENISNAVVCGCLNNFRRTENSLLRPFIYSDILEDKLLKGSTVLDITHEALIRNWKMLAKWNAEEDIYVKDYYDFKSQLTRWLDNDRQSKFLLPEGNLIYFEKWFHDCNLTPYWIAKYDNSKISQQEKLLSADTEYRTAMEFLMESRESVVSFQNRKKRRHRIVMIASFAVMTLLAGFTLWAVKERELAKQESIRANQKTEEAEYQMLINEREKKRAVAAEEAADKERQNAVSEAMKARLAQQEAEKAYKEANLARIMADSMKNIALENLRSAEDARKETEQALVIAEQQTFRATQASDSATRLYNTAVSNALAMKAQNRYEDKSLNLRLAWSSWLMCRDCGVTMNTAELYQAMLFSMAENGFDNKLEITNDKVSDFYIAPNNDILVLSEKSEIIGYKISGDKPQEFMRFQCQEGSSPIEKAFFVSEDMAVFSTKDKHSFLVDLNLQQTFKLPRSGYITCADKLNDGFVATATATGMVDVWNYKDGKLQLVKTFNFDSKVSDLKFWGSDNNVYVLLHKGVLSKCNIQNGTNEVVMDKSPLNAYSMTIIEQQNYVVIGFSDDKIRYYNTQDGSIFEVLSGHAKPGAMIYDPNTKLLARSSDDKRIMLVDTKSFMSQPYTLEEYNLNGGKVKSMRFNQKGVLYVLTDINELRYFDTDIRQYAKSLGTLNLMPLNDMEKRMILGNEFVGEY